MVGEHLLRASIPRWPLFGRIYIHNGRGYEPKTYYDMLKQELRTELSNRWKI
jgi:hypothetical protein